MTSWVINATTSATTRYENYDFDSFCQAEDGKFYGIRADGIYLLDGDDDDGAEIPAYVNLGRVDFGTSVLKHISTAYVTGASSELVTLTLNGFEYPARSYSEEYSCQRFDVGKGLRATYFNPIIKNTYGCNFSFDTFEIAAVPTLRRI